jgi:hypothetical protein
MSMSKKKRKILRGNVVLVKGRRDLRMFRLILLENI